VSFFPAARTLFVSTTSSGGTGAATLSWTPPTRNTDGSTLTNLAGYRISYGTSATSLDKTVQVASPGITSCLVEGLTPGTWYFSIKSYNSTGAESLSTTPVSGTVR